MRRTSPFRPQKSVSFSLLVAAAVCAALLVQPGAQAAPLKETGSRTPGLTSFSPSAGAAGTVVTIRGSHLSGTSSVAFNGMAASSSVRSSKKIIATVPPGASSGPITVTTSRGTATSAAPFTVQAATPIPSVPAITDVSPSVGVAGASVTLSGTNLLGATAVAFNGADASYTVDSSYSDHRRCARDRDHRPGHRHDRRGFRLGAVYRVGPDPDPAPAPVRPGDHGRQPVGRSSGGVGDAFRNEPPGGERCRLQWGDRELHGGLEYSDHRRRARDRDHRSVTVTTGAGSASALFTVSAPTPPRPRPRLSRRSPASARRPQLRGRRSRFPDRTSWGRTLSPSMGRTRATRWTRALGSPPLCPRPRPPARSPSRPAPAPPRRPSPC